MTSEAGTPTVTEPHLFVLSLQADAWLEQYRAAFSEMTSGEAPVSFARALASSPAWAEMGLAHIVLKPAPRPVLWVIGYFTDAEKYRLETLHTQLLHDLPRLRYVTRAQAEADCEVLASKLLERFGRDELQNFRFTAIPRGGFIVLGMLSYLLDLKRSQLEGFGQSDAPLVTVDDVSISGLRFAQFLEHHRGRQVIFAHLYSHPDLRAAMQAREESLLDVLSARDLRDYAPEIRGDDYEAWLERWRQRSDGRSYWIGQPEHMCFPWNEPDATFWNPIAEREEAAWRLVPPELCLKNRVSPGTVRLQIQAEGTGPLKPAEGVIFAPLEDKLVVANLITGKSIALSDVAADMWQAMLEHGNEAAMVKALSETYEVEAQVLEGDVNGFLSTLQTQGFVLKEDAHE